MNLHVIIGEDDFLVSETAKKLVGDGVGLEVIDSNTATNAELQLKDIAAADASFSTPPFLDPSKVTWWKNVKFLPGGVKQKDGEKKDGEKGSSEAVKEALEKFAKKLAANPLPENQKFILSGPRLLMTSVFAKTLKPVAEMAVFSAGKPWEQARIAAERVGALARGMNLAFERGATEAFVARVGTDSRSLMSELSKLRDYLGKDVHTVTFADIDAITSQGVGVEPEVWAITDALGERNLAKALDATRRFEQEVGFAVMVTTVVEKFFRQLVALKDAAERGRSAAATEGMNPYAARKMSGFLRNWTLRELRVARARFLALRERAVASSGSADVLVVAELVRVCRRSAGGGAR